LELSWSTFLFEVINFLVLVWILKRFLYQPVLDVIARRRAGIENELAESRRLHDEAETLKAEYEGRVADWNHERQQARDVLTRELDEERAHQLQLLQAMLGKEREKSESADERRRQEAMRESELHALRQSAQFAAHLLAQASGPELESRLLDVFLDGLSALSVEQVTALKARWGEPPEGIDVTSAYPLAEQQQQRLQQALDGITDPGIRVRFTQDPELVAGLHISIGAWVLHANIRDELKGFAEFAHAVR